MLYHDSVEGNVYLSRNEGKAWARVEDIPEGKAAVLIEPLLCAHIILEEIVVACTPLTNPRSTHASIVLSYLDVGTTLALSSLLSASIIATFLTIVG